MDQLKKIEELRRALNDLRERNLSLKEKFAAIDEFFEAEKFPTQKILEAFHEEYSDWISNTGNVLKLYEKIFDTQIPQSFAEVEAALTAEEKRIIEESIFGRAQKFMSLVAKDVDLQDALIKYKSILQPLLDKKIFDAKTKAAVEPYAKFIEAMGEKNSGKKVAAIAVLSKTFDNDFIGAGLLDKALTLKVAPEVKAAVVPADKKKIPDAEPVAEESQFVQIINATGALLKDADFAKWEAAFTTEKIDHKKEFSASRFKHDSNNPEMLKPVLHFVAMNGWMSSPAVAPKRTSPEMLESIANILVQKGYLQKFSFEGIASFYALSKGFFNFMKTDNGKKFIANKQNDRNRIDNAAYIPDELKYALVRAVYLYIHKIVTAHGNDSYSVDFLSQAFRAEFSGKDERDLFIGCFWDTTDDCEKFIKKLKTHFKRVKKFDRVFVVSLNVAMAEKSFSAIEDVLTPLFPADAAQYIYDFNKNIFYDRDNGGTVTEDEIWQKPEPDMPPDNPDDDDEFADDEDFDDFDDVSDLSAKKIKSPPPDESDDVKVMRNVKSLLLNKKFYCATAYLNALHTAESAHIYNQLAFALDDPALDEGYSADVVTLLAAEDDNEFNQALITAAALRALFYNDFGVDYGVPALHGLIGGFALVKNCAALSELIDTLRDFKTTVHSGIDLYADYQTKDLAVAEKNLAQVIRDADDFNTRFFEGKLTDKADNATFVLTKQIIFARDGDLAQIFRLIRDKAEAKSSDTLQFVKEFLSDNFIKRDANFTAVNIDGDKVNRLIDDSWNAASDRKNPGKLLGSLRTNITKNLKRAVEIMCDWINCSEIFSAEGNDFGRVEYKKIRSRLLANINKIHADLAAKIKTKTLTAAGLTVVDHTLKELAARLDGTYTAHAKKYFYVDFLRGDKVVLDENYLPVLNLNVTDGTADGVENQIIAHAALKLPSFETRIEQIFEIGGDDFGTAILIDNYINDTRGESIIERKEYDLEHCINSAAKDAPRYRESFIGGLELAQSYGHFDGAADGEKEKIFQIAENCYKYAEQSRNFGVFFRVKKYWEGVIAAQADKRVEGLKHELRMAVQIYKDDAKNINTAELNDTVAEIERIIESHNGTVARSLIHKLADGELYKKFDDAEENVLSRFIADYGDCYRKVFDNAYSLENLIGKKLVPHDKVARAKINLIKSWITNPVGEDKIKNLLELLGFDAVDVKKISAPANAIVFDVKTSGTVQTKYYHPIAAFGSETETDGFRVACLFGKYDEHGLISKFKELGNVKHTLVLLDYSLDLPTRRRLAKEIKLDKTLTKVFAPVDRVTIMYLIKNCASQIGGKRINDTLMALVMPFARYQPYIWSPRIPLPPEMFIGREKEINDVMSRDSGVNIVCGGRQLGKSALLKMACRRVECNADERAVYLEITDKNYREAALMTSRELSDKKFFDTPIETDDWEELARAIKNRLASDTPTKINYFLLLLDEADEFIASCAECKYAPIVALAKIQQEKHNGSRFKFVIAGLHNIIRFNRKEVLSDNSILSTLKLLPIKPFGLEDARKLLEVPLRYLGLYFPDDKKDSLILTILETTNYFPSLIQLYCEKLITALFETSYAGYGADTPVYEISEDHIKKVLADEEFIRDIKTKIEITLGLGGDDDYYHAIANLLAYLYYTQNNVDGYTPQELLNAAADFGLVEGKILPDTAEKIDALMAELCELNILRKSGDKRYLFSRQRILRIVGTLNEVEDALLKLMSEKNHEHKSA